MNSNEKFNEMSEAQKLKLKASGESLQYALRSIWIDITHGQRNDLESLVSIFRAKGIRFDYFNIDLQNPQNRIVNGGLRLTTYRVQIAFKLGDYRAAYDFGVAWEAKTGNNRILGL